MSNGRDRSYFASLVEELKQTNEKLKQEREGLQAELEELRLKLQTLADYNRELELEVRGLERKCEEKDRLIEEISSDIDRFKTQTDELVALVMSLSSRYPSNEMEEEMEGFSEFAQNLDIKNDKELMFGINIKHDFLQQSDVQAIQYYLFSCEAKTHESFEVKNLQIRGKSDLKIIGEAFAQYVRIASLSKGENVQGLVEIIALDSQEHPRISYYGNVGVSSYFNEFVQAYSLKIVPKVD